MYTQDKIEIEATLTMLQDDLDDAWKWSAHHDDEFNTEFGELQDKLNEVKDKLKTL